MRPTLNTVCVLHFHQPTGVHPNAIEKAFDDYYEVLLDQIEGSPQLRLNLHFTGTVLEHALAHRPAFLDRLRRLWKQDRIEVLGGAFHDPVLPSIPDRDALGQLRYTSNFFTRHLGRAPLGAWLCLRAWDPGRIRTLAMTGVRYTLLDDAQFVIAGLHPDEIHGWYTTERSGHALSIFPIDATFVDAVQVSDRDGLVSTLQGLARNVGTQRSHPEVFAGDGEALMRSGQLLQLLSVLREEHHWVKTLTLEQAWSGFPGRGRLYLPTSCQPELGDWCRPAAAVARRRTWAREMALMGVWEQAQQFEGGVVWDNFLVKYPEANRVHKRMLRVSRRIDELRTVLARNHRAGKKVEAVRKILEKSCSALWRSQNHSVYWHGGPLNPGIYDPVLRQRTLRELLAAERVIDRVLDGKEPAPWEMSVADHDADGEDEVLVRTPHFSVIIDPGRGGGFWELDLRKRNIALHSSLSPVEEPYHQRVAGNEVLLVDEDEEEITLPPVASVTSAEPALATLTIDRIPRGAFQDHFLGPETTLESFARRQFRELGDFAAEAYEVIKTAEPNGGESGAITVGRSGVVKDLERTLLLRVEKTFRLSTSRARLQVERELENRSRDPASVWYGLEWTFGIPSTRVDKVTVMTLGEGDDGEQVAWNLGGGPVDLGEHSWFEWEDAGSELAIVVELDRPMRLWWVPITTVCMGTDRFHEIVQGNTLLMHGPTEVWGSEKQVLQLRIDFIQT